MSVLNQAEFWSQQPVNKFDNFEISYVLVLHKNAPLETKRFLVSILKDNNLNVSLVAFTSNQINFDKDLVLVVSCEQDLLQHLASQVYQPQQLLRQSDSYLTTSEQQRILLYLLEQISLSERSQLAGLQHVTLYPGQSIVQVCLREGVLVHCFPLHHQDTLRQLTENLCLPFVENLDEIRNYFGEKIAFYFGFLNYYRNIFMLVSAICAISFFFGHYSWITELSTVVICISLFVFLKLWKRQSNILACKWGTINAFELQNARPAFRSKGMTSDPISGKMVPVYPITKTWCKEYLFSLPVVGLCLYVSFRLMCIYFRAEQRAFELYQSNPTLLTTLVSYCPSIIYAVLVTLMNHGYRFLATKLNEYENHRTQVSHENHWIVKLVLFEFVNNFMCLLYIAFYLQDIAMLKWNLITMLTINQIVDNLLESALPLSNIHFSTKLRSLKKLCNTKNAPAMIQYEISLYEYEDTYYDYLELFIQYGYAFLFVAIFPLAPIIAFVNSTIEIRLDALKLCLVMQRPSQRSAKSVNNAWMKSFEVISILVVISNLLVLGIVSNDIQEISSRYHLTNVEFIVLLEHAIFFLVLLIWYIVPDVPKEVNTVLSRQHYQNIKKIAQLNNSQKLSKIN